MRMWNVDPKMMCDKHLIGEHVEMHMFVGSINKGISIKGYVDKGLLTVNKLRERHDELAVEMERRHINHLSPLPTFKVVNLNVDQGAVIDSKESKKELLRRCSLCRKQLLKVSA